MQSWYDITFDDLLRYVNIYVRKQSRPFGIVHLGMYRFFYWDRI